MPRYMRSSPSEVNPCHFGPSHSGRQATGMVAPSIRARTVANAQATAQVSSPNPLLAINIGMGVFFVAAAMVIVLG
jgi:hypothetical protein